MNVEWTPFRWPDAWTDPAALSLLRGTAINYLLIENGAKFDAVRAQAREAGLAVADPAAIPAGIAVVKGDWAGVRRGGGNGASAGPTGVPWVDSNGWAVRLAAAMQPKTAIWVQAAPEEKAVHSAAAYLTTLADTAAYGGRWIITLDTGLAGRLAGNEAAAVAVWKRICDGAAFFAAHKDWAAWEAQATVGVISDFTGEHEFFAGELLNLLARAGQHYRLLRKDQVTPAAFQGLRAVIYADAAAAAPALRGQVVKFVQTGGMLITHAKWGGAVGATAPGEDHPRFALYGEGKGRIALAKETDPDPYIWANDTAVLVSHRYDLVRFWNGGATGSYYTVSPDRKRAIAHLLFYAGRPAEEASVRVAGPYRSARMWTAGAGPAQNVKIIAQKDAVEAHLPVIGQYVALELEA
jgi:hypothetical protein